MLETKSFKGQDFIVFGEDFGRHPHSLEHLLRPLFQDNRFVWVETIGLRSPKFSLYDLKRIAEKALGWFAPKQAQTARAVPETITIVSPFMIPFNKYAVIRKFNKWSVDRTVRKVLAEKNFQNIITVTSVPNACDYVGSFGERLTVFVCVDEFSLWPGLDYDLVRSMENKLLSKSDLVFATSQALVESKNNRRNETTLVTHGVEFNHFNIGPKPMSKSLKICYFGLFDERSDQRIIAEIAKSLPDCQIEIIGKVVCDVTALAVLGNIKFKGSVSYAELPHAIADVDIFILPYVRTELTNNLNPLKLKEYLSTGRPVIATALPEVAKLQEHLLLANNGQEFVARIEDIQHKRSGLNSARTLAWLQASETWNAKAALFSTTLQNYLKGR
ncbi:MAG: glycosyltransferase [Bacillota bacterium]